MNQIQDKKFHTIFMVKRFLRPFKKEEVTIANLLSICLSLSNAKYKTSQEYSRFLDDNYGISPNVRIISYGDYIGLSISLLAIHPKWIGTDSYSIPLLLETFELNYRNPNVWRGQFKKDMFLLAKQELKTAILHYNDDKQSLASKKAISLYLNKDFTELYGECNLEELNQITPKDLFLYYQEFMKSPNVFYVDGDLDGEFSSLYTSPYQIEAFMERRIRDFSVRPMVSEEKNIDQTYLRLFYEGAPFYNEKDNLAMVLGNYIFGGAATSKLFLNVREKEGLCYDISSTYYSSYGFIMVALGVANKDREKAIASIEEQVCSIQNGKITDIEFESLKHKLLNALKSNLDSRSRNIEEEFIIDVFKDRNITYEERKQKISELKVSDVQDVFKKIKLVFTYEMKGALSDEI